MHGHEDVAVIKERTPQPGHAINLPAGTEPRQQRTEPASAGGREKPRTYKTGPRYACYAKSDHWRKTRKSIHSAVKKCAWPPGSKKFTIYPQSGKKRGEGNGVGPIRLEFIKELKKRGWTIEGAAKNQLGQGLGDFDA